MKSHHANIPLLIFSISVLLFVAGLYAYMYHTVNESLKLVLIAREVAAKEQSLLKQEDKLITIYKESEEERKRLSSLFVSDLASLSFIETIEALGPQTGSNVTLSSIDADNLDGTEAGTLGIIKADVSAEGSWESVMRLLKLAELLPYKVNLSGVNLSSEEIGSSAIGKGITDKEFNKRKWSISFKIQAILIHDIDQ